MTKEEEISELEKLRKKTRNVNSGILVLIVVGFFLFAGAMIFTISFSNIIANNHLQNPQMPYDQYPQNASYIWTHKEIMNNVWTLIPIGTIGFLTMIGGFILAYMLPDKKDFHKLGCYEYHRSIKPEWEKYCSECGLKLSELEPKKKHNN